MMVTPDFLHYFSCCNSLIIPNDHHATQSKSSKPDKKPVLETEASLPTAQQLRPSSSTMVALGGGL